MATKSQTNEAVTKLIIVLDISKLNEILKVLRFYKFPEAKWFDLGLNLGLLHPTLEAIEATHRGYPSRCLMECLTKWLTKADDNVTTVGPITWQTLANAIEELSATTIAESIQKTMLDPASQLLQYYSCKISQVVLSEESIDLLHSEGLISDKTAAKVKGCGYLLLSDTMREIYAVVAEDHNKLRAFANILYKTKNAVNIANDLLDDCGKNLESSSEASNEQAIAPSLGGSADELRSQILEFKFQISEEYACRFDRMRGSYGSFCFRITRLVAGSITVDSLEDLKEFIDSCYPELGPKLATAISAKDVMNAIKSKCTVINIVPVEEVVSFYSISEAKPLVMEYNKTVDQFCSSLKLDFMLEKKLSTSDFLVCETIEFVLDWDPVEHLLNDIRRLIEKAFKGLSRRIIVRSMHKGNSIVVICGAPTHLMSALQLEAQVNLHTLKEEFSLIKLTISHYTVYDKRIRDKGLKILNEMKQDGEDVGLDELKSLHSIKQSILEQQMKLHHELKDKQVYIEDTLQSSELKIKQLNKEKSLKAKRKMTMLEQRQLQSALQIKAERKQSLKEIKEEIAILEDNISLASTQLLLAFKQSSRKEQFTQSLSEILHTARDDYELLFKKGELLEVLQAKGYWWKIKSVDTGNEGVAPAKYIGYPMLELLQLFQFAMTNKVPTPEIQEMKRDCYNEDTKAAFFFHNAFDPMFLDKLRHIQSKQYLYKAKKAFIATDIMYDVFSFSEGDEFEVIDEYFDDEWWHVRSVKTNEKGYIPSNIIFPITESSSALKDSIYFHDVSRDEAENKLQQTGTQLGTFLIRRDGYFTEAYYILSIKGRNEIQHYTILQAFGKYYRKQDLNFYPSVKFHTMNELVHYYIMNTEGELEHTLTVPCPKPVEVSMSMQGIWEIERSQVKVLKCISIEEYGETFEGQLYSLATGPVMIKTNIATTFPQDKFLATAKILQELKHDNIIRLYGICSREYPFYIITELMEHGTNLQNYLRRGAGYYLESPDLKLIATEIAKGMDYLERKDYIHCDLRTANILVRKPDAIISTHIVKIANFYHATNLNGSKYCAYHHDNNTMSYTLKWMAPEGYTLNRLGTKSDVWSFGILLWELFNKGGVPYPGMSFKEVCEKVPQNYRMPKPQNCPEKIYETMLNCWKLNDNERPTFAELLFSFS